MDYLVDLDNDLQALIVGAVILEQHGMVIGLFDQVHTAAIGLDVVEHFRVGDDVIDAVPVAL